MAVVASHNDSIFSVVELRRLWGLVALSLLVLSVSSVVKANAGNCTQSQPLFIEGAATLYNISGTEIRVHPKENGQVRYDVILAWSMELFIEREKVRSPGGGPPEYNAPSPSFDPRDGPVDPFLSGVTCPGSNLPCGRILNAIYTADMDCWAEKVIAPFHGTTRESVYIHYLNSSDPGFHFIGEHHLVDSEVIVPLGNPGAPVVEVYSPNSLKVAYQWINYQWVEDSPVEITISQNYTSNNGSTFEFWVGFQGMRSRLLFFLPSSHPPIFASFIIPV